MRKQDMLSGRRSNRRPRFLRQMVVALMLLVLGLAHRADAIIAGQGKQAAKPILTKSGKKAAISKAAAAIIQAHAAPAIRTRAAQGAAGVLAPVAETDETKVPHKVGAAASSHVR